MRCYNCGSENVDQARFCEKCAAPLSAVTQGQVNDAQFPPPATRKKSVTGPLLTLVLGIGVSAVGFLIYLIGLSSAFSMDFNDPNWGSDAGMDVLGVSYIVMCIGGLIFAGGLIWLVLRSD